MHTPSPKYQSAPADDPLEALMMRDGKKKLPPEETLLLLRMEEKVMPQKEMSIVHAHLKMVNLLVLRSISTLEQAAAVRGEVVSSARDSLAIMLRTELKHTRLVLTKFNTLLKEMDSHCEQHDEPPGKLANAFLTVIQALAYQVENIVQKQIPPTRELHLQKGSGFFFALKTLVTGCFNIALNRAKLEEELEGIRGKLSDILTLVEPLGLATQQPSSSDGGRYKRDMWVRRKTFVDLYFDETSIVGFEEHRKTLVDKVLVDPALQCFSIISIVGMAGLGKTTLAYKVYKDVKSGFDCSAMVYVSQRPNVQKLLRDVAKQVGLVLDMEEGGHLIQEEDLETKLHAYLEDKRYLILLDDIWNSQAWDSLKVAIPDKSNTGSRIITTSRKKDVGREIGGGSFIYELQPVDKENSFDIFCKKASKLIRIKGHELESVGRKIVGKCGGVPLAIEDLVNSLQRTANEGEWHVKQESNEMLDGQCSRALVLSYEDLPSRLQSCLLYLGIYPEYHEFSASDIINQWIAERFVETGALEPEDVGRKYLDRLEYSNLIQVSSTRFDGSIRNFRVHEIVHSFCIWMATNTYFFDTPETYSIRSQAKLEVLRTYTTDNLGIIDKTGARRLASLSLSEIDGQSAFLRTIICTEEGALEVGSRDWVSFSDRFKLLRVLIVGSSQLSYCLPKNLGVLSLLRYLGSTGRSWPPTRKKLPSTVFNLKWLQTVDLRNIECETIPKGIWKMEQLRHILFRKPSLRTKSRTEMGKGEDKSPKYEVCLPNLQTLHVAPGNLFPAEVLQTSTKFRKLGIFYPTDTILEQLSNSVLISNKLEILWLSCAPRTTVNLSSYLTLNRLHLKIDTIPLHLPPNIVKLILVLHDMRDDQIGVLKGLQKLKILKLYVDRYNTNKIVISGGPEAFPELEVLELYLPFYIRNLTVEEYAMPKLKKVPGISSRLSLDVTERIRAICLKRTY